MIWQRYFSLFILLYTLVIFTQCFESSKSNAEEVYTKLSIVDHTAVQEFEQIPDYWLEKAKELTMHYGHTSHGSQIISGLNYLETYVDPVKYSAVWNDNWSNPIPPEEDPPAIRIWVQGSQPDEYWDGEEGINETRAAADTGLYDFSMWSWCGEVSYMPTEYIQRYLDTMNMFEQEYPDMRFIYMTGHRRYTSSLELLHNDMIREYCRNNDKILYDFADIESWDPDGNYHHETTDLCEWAEAWCAAHPEDAQNLPTSYVNGTTYTGAAHTHGFNCVLKAKAYWYMMARLAGWDGTH